MQNKVTCGLFAFVAVQPGSHAAYNWWHSYEHQPEFQTLPSEVLAARYVATPELMAARPPGSAALAGAQYFVPYFHQGPPEASLKERADHNRWLIANAPNFTGNRTTPFSGAFDFAKGYVAPRLRISAEALPFRPHTGVHVTMVDLKDQADARAVEEWYDQVHFPDMLTLKGFAGVWRFVSRRHPDFPNPAGRFVHIYYLDEDPAEAVAGMRAKLPVWFASGRGPKTLAGPLVLSSSYKTIIEGKDQTYDWFDK